MGGRLHRRHPVQEALPGDLRHRPPLLAQQGVLELQQAWAPARAVEGRRGAEGCRHREAKRKTHRSRQGVRLGILIFLECVRGKSWDASPPSPYDIYIYILYHATCPEKSKGRIM